MTRTIVAALLLGLATIVPVNAQPAETNEPAGADAQPAETNDAQPTGTDAPGGTDAQPVGTDAQPPGTDALLPGANTQPPGTDALLPGASAPAGANAQPVERNAPVGTNASAGANAQPAGANAQPAGANVPPVEKRHLPPAHPSSQVRRTLHAARRQGPISIDGKVDEPAWNAAEAGTDLTQVEPDDGAPATVPTRLRVLWDDDAIYVGIECNDILPPTVTAGPRDEAVDGDLVDVDFATTGDHRTAYHFGIYASGQQVDGMHVHDTGFNLDWNATWESAVRVGDHGWSAELRIPLRVMRIPNDPTEFGFNFSRTIVRHHETEYWQYQPRGAPGGVSGFGRLVGIDGLQPVSSLELLPYLSARAYRYTPSAPGVAPLQLTPCLQAGFDPSWGVESCAGLELRYAVTGNLKLTASLNPDFGEVEPDQRVQNLTTTEVYLPEKRTFFLEGSDLFNLPASSAWQPYYSRRIGQTLWPSTSPGVLFTPAVSPVAGALQLSGSVHSTELQALAAYEPGAFALLQVPGGGIAREEEAPPLLSAVVRARGPAGDAGVWGVMATASEPSDGLHAHVGVVDTALSDSSRTWNLAAQLGGSSLVGPERVVNFDGTVLTGGSTGLGFSAVASKRGGGVIGSVSLDVLTPQFTVDALGYMPRANLVDVQGSVGWRALKDGRWWRSLQVLLAGDEQHDFAGVLQHRKVSLEGSTTFRNYWSTTLGASVYGQTFDDRELGDGTPFERPGYLDLRAAIDSDAHGRWAGGLTLEQQEGIHASASSTSLGGNLSVRPTPSLGAFLRLDLENAAGDIRRLRTATGLPEAGGDPQEPIAPDVAPLVPRLYLFAPQASRSLDAELRLTAVPRPRLTVQAFAQLFLAGLSWGSPLRAAVNPGRPVITLDSLSPARPGDLAPNGDYRQSAVDLSLQVTWEWRPGSTLSLAYVHTSYSSVDSPANPLMLNWGLNALSGAGSLQNDVLFVRFDMLLAR